MRPVFAIEFKRQTFHLPVNKQRRIGSPPQKGEESVRRYQILAYKVRCRDEKRPRAAAADEEKRQKAFRSRHFASWRSNAKLLLLTVHLRA
ncbi:unnamed protein product, partial [Iphiclides podalirius]